MVPGYALNTYRNSIVFEGMDPKQLVLILYEEALKRMQLAKQAIIENDPRKRGEHLGRAIAIISELNASLDPKIRDESIEFLRGLYAAILRELPKVSVSNDPKILDLACAYVARLKEIWKNDVMGGRTGKEVAHETSKPAESANLEARSETADPHAQPTAKNTVYDGRYATYTQPTGRYL